MDEPQAESPKVTSSEKWTRELHAALQDKDVERYLNRGRKTVRRYMSDGIDATDGLDTRYNVFWSNVGVLKSALYANPPKPVVKRAFDDYKDQPGRVAGVMMERLLHQPLEDSGSQANLTFRQVVEDRLIPGLGQVWCRYEPTIENEMIIDEEVEIDYLYWEDFIWSPCRTWEECRWVARRCWMTKKEFIDRFGKDHAGRVSWTNKPANQKGEVSLAQDSKVVKKTEVFEIWCKTSRTVHFISLSCDYELDSQDDPLELEDFFPCPRPLLATHSTASLVPKNDYMMTQTQYMRLEDLTIRIGMLEDAIQASGVYDKENAELSSLLNGSKVNRMIPVDNWAMFAEKGGMKTTVDWFPLDMIVSALDKLRELKTEAKAELYELTGISDIMRGVSAPRETAQAQNLKAQYSSVRLQFIQGEVAEFVQDALRIKGEIIGKHFDPQTIVRNSQIMLTPDAPYAQEAVQIIKDEWSQLYRIVIYADTLSIPDYNAERQGRTEFIGAMGQFISQATPMLQQAPETAPFFMQILQWAVASFRSAQSIEGVFNQMLLSLENKAKQPPPPPPPDPKMLKTQAEVQAIQQKSQAQALATKSKVEGDRMKTEAEIQNQAMRTQAQIESNQIEEHSQMQQIDATTQAQLVASITKAVTQALQAKHKMEMEKLAKKGD